MFLSKGFACAILGLLWAMTRRCGIQRGVLSCSALLFLAIVIAALKAEVHCLWHRYVFVVALRPLKEPEVVCLSLEPRRAAGNGQ